MFALDSRLQQDTIALGDFPLCRLLLSKDANYPWFILVPRRPAVREIIDLPDEEQWILWQESQKLSRLLQQCYAPDKLNIAALGNMVPQLHLHHIVRYEQDAAWPAPVWGKLPPRPYSDSELESLKLKMVDLTVP